MKPSKTPAPPGGTRAPEEALHLHPEAFARRLMEDAERHQLKGADLLVLLALWTHTNRARRGDHSWAHALVWPSEEELARLSGKSPRWVRDVSLRALEHTGLVWTVRPPHPVQLGEEFNYLTLDRHHPARLVVPMCDASALRAFVGAFGVAAVRGAGVAHYAPSSSSEALLAPPVRRSRAAG